MAGDLTDEPSMRKTIRTVALWMGGFSLLHSFLASRRLKAWIKRHWGERLFDGVYRLVFNLQALVTFSALLWRFASLPDRTLYHIRLPWAVPLRLVQLGAILMALDANHRIGIGRMTGVQGAWELLRRRTPIHQNPAQGPQMEGNLSFPTGGSFQLTRHPNNLVPLLLFLSNPKMSLRFLTFTAVAAIYLVLGSIHEEQRLHAAYGRRYDRYRQGKPFYFPHP
jgi:protein-S-isoprenylcysteine O-methyltransferase Ste14